MKNKTLKKARTSKNDEFYTQYSEIEKEIEGYYRYNPSVFEDKTILLPCDNPEYSHFTKFFLDKFEEYNIKKLISTSYRKDKKGKFLSFTKDDKKIGYLEGDGDFSSIEVSMLRDEADIIITNPPFSKFREFIQWIFEKEKKFIILGNMNAITYKELFQHIKNDRIWLGGGKNDGRNVWYQIPNHYENFHKIEDGKKFAFVPGTIWFTNIDHGKRHKPLNLKTKDEIIRIRKEAFDVYENYDAIEIPRVNYIPSDYSGIMGVPISFLSKYCPEQFDIIDINPHFFIYKEMGLKSPTQLKIKDKKDPYARILIQHKKV
jgi:hypothetical protein